MNMTELVPSLQLPNQLLDEEIQVDEQNPPQQQQHIMMEDFNLNIGLALVPDSHEDPCFVDYTRAKNAKGTRLWAHHLAPGTNSVSPISIPRSWANFFTVALYSNHL